jgi:DNA-directed RNA polymerase subunit RPC12/RpoP
MKVGKIIAYIAAAILIFFGVLFIWGAFSPDGSTGWIFVGIISIGLGLILIWLGSRSKPVPVEEKITLQIDLPGDVNLDSLKCQTCGGALTTNNIEMVAGAPVVNCPYCGTSYQITEDPKW